MAFSTHTIPKGVDADHTKWFRATARKVDIELDTNRELFEITLSQEVGKPLYECTCGNTLFRRRDFLRHRGEPRYECPKCDRDFSVR